MNKSKLIKNILTGFGGQLIAIILGLVVPRIFITGYGSDLNGLLSTVTQIFTYLALLEAGIGQAARNLLYKPFQEKNREQICAISGTAKQYFGKFSIYYCIGVVLLSLILPFILKTTVDPITISLIILLEGMAGVISFYFIETPSIIISVDGKNYVNNTINLVNKIFSNIVKIVLATFGINIIFLQFINFLITVAKVVFYSIYFRKKYSWVDFVNKDSDCKLKDRNSYIVTEICWAVFSSTDMIVLSIFVSTQMSSVYSIYNMIFSNISLLLNSIYMSLIYLLGLTFHKNKNEYEIMHDNFNSLFFGMITSLMIICYYLILPFITLYTKGVSDVNYIVEELPVLFCLVQLFSWSRYVSGNLIGIAGRIRKSVIINIVEAALNLFLSIVLVKKFGIMGVLFATTIALPIKGIYCNYIGDRIILKRSCNNTVKILGINYALFFIAVFLKSHINIIVDSYKSFFFYGVILSVIVISLVIIINAFVNPKVFSLIQRIKNKIFDRKKEVL